MTYCIFKISEAPPKTAKTVKSDGGSKRGRGRPKGSAGAGGVGRGQPKKAEKSAPKKAKSKIQDYSDVESDEIQEVHDSLDEGSDEDYEDQD